MVSQAQRAAILKGCLKAITPIFPQPLIIDTNRAWTAQITALLTLFPDAKLICTVRDVAWVLDSLERQYRANAFENTRLFNSPAERATVYTRLEALAGANRLVGFSWQALREACFGDHADRLVIVDCDLLTSHPADVIKLLYEFLGEPLYPHDFSNVMYDAPDFDDQLGLRGLHTVRPKVEQRKRRTILPPDLFKKYSGMAFWHGLNDSKAFRIVAQRPTAE